MDEKNQFDTNASFEELASRYINDEPKKLSDNSAPSNSTYDKPIAPPVRSSYNNVRPTNNVQRAAQPINDKRSTQVKNSNAGRQNLNRELNKPVRTKKAADKSHSKQPLSQNKFIENFLNNEKARNTYIFFGVVILISVILSVYAGFCVNDVLAINKSKDEVTISSTNIETLDDAIDLLHDNKLINCPVFCKLFTKTVSNLSSSYKKEISAPYTKGVFSVNSKMGLEGMLVTLKGDISSTETVEVAFPEGFTVPDIINRLAENGVCDKTALYKAIEQTEFTYALTSALKPNEKRAFRLEGYLFPDTYEFYVGENPNSVLKRFVSNTEEKITQKDREQAEKLGMTMDQVLTLASIIQKEAANTKQMGIISSVLHNRLDNGNSYPLLECDSTGDYVSKHISKSLTVNSKYDSAYYNQNYNTYVTKGLPVGPICNPGAAAINAALYPEKTNYYFFCHDSKGNMYTAETLSEHRANVSKYVVS